MTVSDILKKNASTHFTIEILPPIKGLNFTAVKQMIDPLISFAPSYVNITYHRPEVIQTTDSRQVICMKRRPATLGVAAAIKYRYGIEVVPHIICGGLSKAEIEDMLVEFSFMEIENLLVLRGDPAKNETSFVPHPNGHAHAADLLTQIKKLSQAKYLDTTLQNPLPLSFCCGVAGYPEKHIDAANFDIDLQYLKRKIDAGADYIVTQLFFDNKDYFQFVEKCRLIGITVPIIPGIKPLSSLGQKELLPRIFNITFPEELTKNLNQCTSSEEVYQLGIEWAIMQSKELRKANVPVIHYYTMGRPKNIETIIRSVF